MKLSISSGQVLETFQDNQTVMATGVAISNDGSTFAIARALLRQRESGGRIDLFSARNDRLIHSETYNTRSLGRLQYLPESDRLVFQSGNNAIYIADNAGTSRPFLTSHLDHVSDIAMLPIDGMLVTASADGTIRFWDADSGAERLLVTVFAGGDWLAMTPEGFLAGTPSVAKRLRVVVDGRLNLPIDSFYDALYRPDLVFEALRGDPLGILAIATDQLKLSDIWDPGAPPRVVELASREGLDVDRQKIDLTLPWKSATAALAASKSASTARPKSRACRPKLWGSTPIRYRSRSS